VAVLCGRLSSGPHPPQSLDEILIWIQVAIHYRIGLGWAVLSPHSQPIHDAQGWVEVVDRARGHGRGW